MGEALSPGLKKLFGGAAAAAPSAPRKTLEQVYASRRAAYKPIADKLAFQVSQYSGPLSYGPFKQESKLPAFHAPNFAVAVEKKAAPTTPAGLLSMSRGVGYPKVTTPGGSIAEIAKPKGFGKPPAGATNPNSLL